MTEFKGHSHQKYGHITYSQHGEDLLFMNLCKFLNLEKPTYLDIGAYHPINISNTALLYQNGARGVNVEANLLLMSEFLRVRPEDTNVFGGIVPNKITDYMPFYMESDFSALNSFDQNSFKQHHVEYHKIEMIPVGTLNRVVDLYCDGKFPDFLMTDIEDLDFEVLCSADFSKSKPKVICSEIREHQSAQTAYVMNQKGFTFLCRMGENRIFIDSNLYLRCM